jgi:hypothetical protein
MIPAHPNSALFIPTATLNAGGVIAMGLAINPTNLMNGQYIFNAIPDTVGSAIDSGMSTPSSAVRWRSLASGA